LQCLGSNRVERSEQPQVYAKKSIEYPRSDAAEFMQDREDARNASRIRKRQDQLDTRLVQKWFFWELRGIFNGRLERCLG
jgi:hypothetical protein